MMYLKPTPNSIFLMLLMILSTIMSITASNWLFLWMGLEINLMAFIPLMMNLNLNQTTEGAIKYFIIQAMSSSTLLFATLLMTLDPNWFFSLMILLSLMTKLGAAPCHFWFPQIATLLSWPLLFLMLTWQKITPLVVVATLCNLWPSETILVLIIMNAYTGSIGGINQTQVRPLLAFSSIAHMAWMFSGLLCSYNLTLVYFMFYVLSLSIFMPYLMLKNFNLTQSNMSIKHLNSIPIILNILSISGMPPFMGFVPKWLMLLHLSEYPMVAMILILASTITLMFYMSLFINYLLNPSYPHQSVQLTIRSILYMTLILIIPTLSFLPYFST